MVNRGAIINELYEKYKDETDVYYDRFKNEKLGAVPHLLTRITTSLVPNMMSDIAKIKRLSGREKKQIIEDAIIYIIDDLHTRIENIRELNLTQTEWDEHVRDVIKMMVPVTIDMLIDVEKGKLKFNKRLSIVFMSLFAWCV